MFNKLWVVLCVLSFITAAEAQTFSYQPPPTSQPKKSGSNLLPVLSPKDYRKAVSSAAQQNKSGVTKGVDQTLSKIQPVMPPPPSAVSAAPSGLTTTTVPRTPNPPPPQSITPVNDQTVQTANPIRPPASPGTTAPTYTGYPSTVPQYPNQPQPQSQVYTGFQAPPPAAAPSSGTQQPKSGGWNIKY